jgi:hypothetical protein
MTMKKVIHVNQHNIRYNSKNEDKKPVITCKTYKDNTYANEVKMKEQCKICGGKGYHKLSCPNNVNRPKEINIEKPKQR